MLAGGVVGSVVAGEFFRVIPILKTLHHEVELPDGNRKSRSLSNTVMASSAAREIAHGIFHFAVRLRPLLNRGFSESAAADRAFALSALGIFRPGLEHLDLSLEGGVLFPVCYGLGNDSLCAHI